MHLICWVCPPLVIHSTISVTPSPGSSSTSTIVSVFLLLCLSSLSEWWFPPAICPYSTCLPSWVFLLGEMGGGLIISVTTSNETIHTSLKQDLKAGINLLGFWLRPQDNRCQLVPYSRMKFYSTWAELEVESTSYIIAVLMYLHKVELQRWGWGGVISNQPKETYCWHV